MKPGRPSWTSKCPPETLRLATEAVAAQAQTAREIWDELNLRRFVKFRTFQLWLTRARRQRAARAEPQMTPMNAEPESAGGGSAGSPSASPTSSGDASDPTRYCLEAMLRQVAAGRIGKVDLTRALRALATLEKLKFEGAAEKRAAELHEQKMTEYRAKQNAALEAVSRSSQLTPEQVAEIRLRVLGL